MQNPDFERDSFEDILFKDARYSPRAYAFLIDVLENLQRDGVSLSSREIMNEFKEYALDLYGPLAYFVLKDWGVAQCEDIGEMMFNLVDSGRIGTKEDSAPECFTGGYDFHDAFVAPYEAL